MKANLHSLLDIVKRPSLSFAGAVLMTVAGGLSPASLAAQERSLQIVPSASTADMFLGTRENPTSYGVGSTRVTGTVSINRDDLTQSSFNLTLYPADRSAEDPAGSESVSAGSQPAISFQSQNVTLLSDGRLEAAGQMTVIEVSRNAEANPTEDYAGPKFGPAMVSKTTQPASFIFALPAAQSAPATANPDGSDGATLLEASQSLPDSVGISGTATINGEAFPELEHSVVSTVWPVLMNDLDCSAPTSVGDDYSGAVCSGTELPDVAPPTLPTSVGDDYAGARLAPAPGNQLTIQLHLKLADTANPSSIVGSYGTGDIAGQGNLQ